jgi:hypothetical protein
MSIVSETISSFLPSKRKQTPSGWLSFNGPCCVHNGTSADNRMRAGIIEEGESVSYHCFNCGYKASWQPGRHISFKLKQLMIWLGVPDDAINKLAIEVLKINEGVETQYRSIELPTFESVPLPENAVKIHDDPCDVSTQLTEVKEYMSGRKLWIDEGYEYYWSSSLAYRDRLIIPFYYEGRIVGWTARTVKSDKKPKYITESQPGFVFNLDEQRPQKVFCIVVEGPIDAIHIDGVALMRAEINDQQAMLIDRLNREVIVLPDRDKTGAALIEQAIDRGWSVSMPDWAPEIKDVNDAVLKYGRLYTLYSIVSAAETSPLKIRLRAKKWYVNL